MPTPNHPLPKPFQAWIRGAFLVTRRISAPHMRMLALKQLDAWRGGDKASAFPGYDAPPPNDFESTAPAGWSAKAFQRLRREAQEATSLVRIGTRL